MQNSSGRTNLLILVVRVRGLKGVERLAKAAESKNCPLGPDQLSLPASPGRGSKGRPADLALQTVVISKQKNILLTRFDVLPSQFAESPG